MRLDLTGEPIQLAHERVELKLREPLVISSGRWEGASVLRVALTWGGVTGHGEAAPQEEDGQSLASAAAFLDAIAAELGDDPFAIEAICERMSEHAGESAAKAGVNMALHDLVGTLLGQPTWRLLGLRPSGPPTSFTLSLRTPEETVVDARRMIERHPDIRIVKLKLGAGDGRDLERVEAVRAVTPLPFTVDANGAWELDEALELIPRLPDLGVRIVEQPLPARSPDGPALKARSPLPVYADEDVYTLADVAPAAQRAHGINVKLVKCGGIREAVRMVHAARALGLGVMFGGMVESGLGMSAAIQLSSLADAVNLDSALLLVHDPAPAAELIDGVMVAPDRPGLGVRW